MDTKLQKYKCINGFTLKLIALLTMTIDHAAAVIDFYGLLGDVGIQLPFDPYWLMRCIGRIAFPIYCFLLVEGYFHTRSAGKYLGRLLFCFVLSDIPFSLAFGYSWPNWENQNVMLTLAIGLAAVWITDHRQSLVPKLTSNLWRQKVLSALLAVGSGLACIELAEFCNTDYGGGGILLILLFYYLRKRPALLTLAVFLELFFCFWWVEAIGIIAMIPILLYNGERGPCPGGKAGQWFFYLYYPVHIGMLVLIGMTIYGPGLYTFGV